MRLVRPLVSDPVSASGHSAVCVELGPGNKVKDDVIRDPIRYLEQLSQISAVLFHCGIRASLAYSFKYACPLQEKVDKTARYCRFYDSRRKDGEKETKSEN